MDYVNAAQMAMAWGLSVRRLQILCAEGKIEGAKRLGRSWMIPKDAKKPADGRTRQGKERAAAERNMPMPRKTPFLHMTDLYAVAGKADEGVEALSDHPEAQTLLAAEIAYSRGQIDKVYDSAYHLLHKHSGFYAVLSAGMLLALCAIWRGDLNLWRQAKIHIAEAPVKVDSDRDLMAFSLTAVDSILYHASDFPPWFQMGRFELIPADAMPAAKVFYAKYLYATAYAVATRQMQMEGLQGLTLMKLLPYTLEPMISQAMADRSLIAEIYLRMTCAAVYYTAGNTSQAVYHVDRALEKALPDRLYGLLAEYCRILGALLEQRLSRTEPEAWLRIQALYEVYNGGWTKLSGSVRGKNLATTLTPKEREVAKLAAFGLKNQAIADALHVSLSAVKQAVTSVSNKTGMSREEFAAVL